MNGVVVRLWRGVANLTRPSKARNVRRARASGNEPESFEIRDATPADIPALARLHVGTWNATYAPLLAVGPGVDVRVRQWEAAFAKHDPFWFCFVVEREDGELVGFAQANRSDNPDFDGTLNKIYLRRDYQRLGLGRRLLSRVARRFLSLGIESMWLYGDARNPSSRAWLALGAEKTDADPAIGNYGWRDIRRLVEPGVSTRLIQHVGASRATVYRALLDPDAIAMWMVPDGMTSVVHEFDARKGGAFRISLTYDSADRIGKSTAHTDTYHGRFVRLIPDELVVEVIEFETDDPAMRGEMTVTLSLTDADGGTDIHAVHDHLPPGVAPSDNEIGWRMSLGKLARLVAGDPE